MCKIDFFDLLDQNIVLKETLEKVKQEYIILNVELNQYKSLGLNKDLNDVFMNMFSTDFQKLKLDLETCKIKNQ